MTKSWNCLRNGEISSDQNKWWNRWFPPTFPKASYSVRQLCGSFLRAWIEPWRLLLSSNVSGLLFGQNRWKPKYLPYPPWQTWHLGKLSPLTSLGPSRGFLAVNTGPQHMLWCVCSVGSKEWGMAQSRNWIPTGWQAQKRPQELNSTLQAAPWVKQCLGTAGLVAAVFWQHGCEWRWELSADTAVDTRWLLCASAEALQRLLGFSTAVAPLAGVPGVGSDGWWKMLSFLSIKRNPSQAQGWMEWAGSSVQLGLGLGLKPGCSHPYIPTDLAL